MFFSSTLNPKTSLLVSLLSGAGLLAIVAIAPTQDEVESDSPARNNALEVDDEKSAKEDSGFRRAIRKTRESFSENPSHPSEKIRKEAPTLLNMRVTPGDLRKFSEEHKFLHDRLGPNLHSFRKIMDVRSFTPERYALGESLGIDRRFTSWENESIRIESSHNQNTFFAQPILDGQYGRTLGLRSSRYMIYRAPKLDYLDIDVPISQSVSAVFTTASRDIYDDSQRDGRFRNVPLAGISLNKGEILSTRFVAGDSNLQLNRQTANPALLGGQYLAGRDPGFNENESAHFRTFEWQTNLKPTKGVRLQTALYNNPVVNPNQTRDRNTAMPDSGRMSVFLGEKRVVLNLKYDYQMSQENMRTAFTQWQPKNDSASLGFIFFLDPSQKYSVYVGGNQHHITERAQGGGRASSDERLPASFTASFRGKTGGKANSNFFVNFQNQPPGLWGMGMPNQVMQDQSLPQSKSFYEYATTLGLEVNF